MKHDITMKGTIDFYLPKFRQNRDEIVFGDCTLKIGKKELPVKFRETVWNLESGADDHLLIHFQAREMDRISYAAAYDGLGLLADDINMELISKMTGIAEFPVSFDCEELGERGMLPPQIINHYGSFAIKELSFGDGENLFVPSEKILEDHTENVKIEAAMIRQLVGMLHH